MPAGEFRLLWTPAAERDVQEIWRYYASTQTTTSDAADKMLSRVREAGVRAAKRPLMWRPRQEARGLRAIPASPYLLFFRVAGSNVEIVRVLHQKRDIAAAIRSETRL